MRSVLIFSDAKDPHATAVEDALLRLGARSFRVLTERLGKQVRITRVVGRESSRAISVSVSGVGIEHGPECSLWNRRIREPALASSTPADIADVVRREAEALWHGIIEIHDGIVVGRPSAIWRASNKADQLAFALRFGRVRVPDTLVSNDPDAVTDFFRFHGGNICYKLFRGASVERGGETLFVYTNLLQETHLQRRDIIERTPGQYQEYIPKAMDVRVTYVGREPFAAAIHSQDSPVSKIDFRRYDFERVRYESCQLPDAVHELCLGLLDRYGLNFGAFDFVVTHDGEYVFLELNPNGQWLWIEERTGLPVADALARLLADRSL